ncbi:MAG: hypothetical protein WCC12_14810, partial [Anaerolineales bacterium]
LVIVGCRTFRRCELGEFVCQLVGFVDQNRQALRADIKFFPLKFEDDERAILFGCAAVQAG